MIRQIAFSNSRRNALSVDTLHNIKQQILAANTSLDDGKVYLLPEFKPSLLHSYLAGQRDETSSWFFDSEMFMKRRRELPKVLVLSTEGPVFSSGHDLHELCRLPRSEVLDTFRLCSEVMTLVMRSPQVVITRVQGLATAAGLQLASTSDLVIASSKASFATPGVNIGLYCTTPGIALSRNLPSKHAFKMLATGFPLSAGEAHGLGLVSEVVDERDLDERMDVIADKIARAPGHVSAFGKWAFNTQKDMGMEDALNWGASVMALNAAFPDAVEGMTAFTEKRMAAWLI